MDVLPHVSVNLHLERLRCSIQQRDIPTCGVRLYLEINLTEYSSSRHAASVPFEKWTDHQEETKYASTRNELRQNIAESKDDQRSSRFRRSLCQPLDTETSEGSSTGLAQDVQQTKATTVPLSDRAITEVQGYVPVLPIINTNASSNHSNVLRVEASEISPDTGMLYSGSGGCGLSYIHIIVAEANT